MVCTEISCWTLQNRKKTVAGHSEFVYKLFGMHVFYASDKFLPENVIAMFSNFEYFFPSICNGYTLYLNHCDH